MKKVLAPHLGRHVVVGGRRRPTTFSRRLQAHTLLQANLPAPPNSTHYETVAMTALRKMFLNDQLGDCVRAGAAHRIGVLTANAGAPFVYSDAQVLTEYERVGGYVPGRPDTDQGCDMSVSADDGVTHGYADGSRDAGWISVDATNKTEVMQMIYLFEDGDLGIELPDAWLQAMPNGDNFVWDVAGDPDPNNGHCIQIVDVDIDRGARISTWGLLGWMPWRALAKYGAQSAYGELIIHVNVDQLIKATQKAPNGFDWSTLVTYFDQMGGHVPVPTPPVPPTPPIPSPTPAGFTPALATQIAKAALDNAPRLMSRAMAESVVAKALASWHV